MACKDYETTRTVSKMQKPKVGRKTMSTTYTDYESQEAARVERNHAQVMVREAVKKRIIAKPCICSECNSYCKRTHAHHEDYTKVYNIQWLCSSCHGKRRKRSYYMEIDIAGWPHNHVIKRFSKVSK